MSDSPAAPYEGILKLCAQASPAPWYPADFAREKAMDAGHLDGPLDQLRLAGLIELTDWVSGKGQGYRLTPEGAAVLQSPRMMSYLRAGQIPVANRVARSSPMPDYDGTPYSRGEIIRGSLAQGAAPRVTQVLIALNFLVFVVGYIIAAQNGRGGNYFLGDVQTAHTIGSLSGPDLVKGEWWRLLGCCFVHYGVLHIGMNMYALWVVGRLAEQIWGRWRYLVIYFVAGICGSCAAVLASPGVPSAGASGAIWGVLACLPAWLFMNRRHLPQRLVSDWMRQLITVVIINAVISFIPGISWAAHFGGGAAGFAAAVLLNLHRFGREPFRWVFILLVPLLPIASVGAVVRAKERSPAWAKMVQGVKQEKADAADRQEEKEIDKVNQELVPTFTKARAEAEAAFEDFESLRTQKPRARDPQKVQAALEKLKGSQDRLHEALRKIKDGTPFRTEFVASAMGYARSYCDHADKRAALAQECLRAGDDWDKDKALYDQNNIADNALKDYDAKRHRADE